MLKALDQNMIFKLGIAIAKSFSGMALNMFWKRALLFVLFVVLAGELSQQQMVGF